MDKVFEGIKTAEELVDYTIIHGTPCDMESICRMQDIFGHSSYEELSELANSTKNGEKRSLDTQNAFYSLLFKIWNWTDAVRFWNDYTNPQKPEFKELKEKNDVLAERNKYLTDRRDELNNQLNDGAKQITELMEDGAEMRGRIFQLEEEVTRLKAKLYDMMMAEAGA